MTFITKNLSPYNERTLNSPFSTISKLLFCYFDIF